MFASSSDVLLIGAASRSDVLPTGGDKRAWAQRERVAPTIKRRRPELSKWRPAAAASLRRECRRSHLEAKGGEGGGSVASVLQCVGIGRDWEYGAGRSQRRLLQQGGGIGRVIERHFCHHRNCACLSAMVRSCRALSVRALFAKSRRLFFRDLRRRFSRSPPPCEICAQNILESRTSEISAAHPSGLFRRLL